MTDPDHPETPPDEGGEGDGTTYDEDGTTYDEDGVAGTDWSLIPPGEPEHQHDDPEGPPSLRP
ncbi:MAG TPA: hypothetical protein VEW93_02305 [Acidimicrobiales bacterium]|nr:hypothetical protein [Acidimicrobiales bacterium]